MADPISPVVTRDSDSILLANAFLEARLDPATGLFSAITNRLTREAFSLMGDVAGLDGSDTQKALWRVRFETGGPVPNACDMAAASDHASASFSWILDNVLLRLIYTLEQNAFWIERRLYLEVPPGCSLLLDRLFYGRLQIEGVDPSCARILDLGRFDRPRLLSAPDREGGLFAGVGWWFYSVDENGIYQNTDMQFPCPPEFATEPWYVGLFASEPYEPWPGWTWYKTFLEDRKAAYDKQKAWCYWNTGWGMPDVDVDHPRAPDCLRFASRVGIPHLALGHGHCGYGQAKYIELAAEPTPRAILDEARDRHIVLGTLEPAGGDVRWTDDAQHAQSLERLDQYVRAGYGALHFDFSTRRIRSAPTAT